MNCFGAGHPHCQPQRSWRQGCAAGGGNFAEGLDRQLQGNGEEPKKHEAEGRMAVREGFEPSVPFYQYGSLANY